MIYPIINTNSTGRCMDVWSYKGQFLMKMSRHKLVFENMNSSTYNWTYIEIIYIVHYHVLALPKM